MFHLQPRFAIDFIKVIQANKCRVRRLSYEESGMVLKMNVTNHGTAHPSSWRNYTLIQTAPSG